MEPPLPPLRGLRGCGGRPRRSPTRGRFARARAGLSARRRAAKLLLAAGAALGAWALWFEPRRLLVRGRTLRLHDWPAALDGLRVAVASDLHAGSPQVRPPDLRRVARGLQAAGPELVVFLGDFVDHEVVLGEEVPPEAAARALAGLDAPLGVFGLLGNHDWRYDGPRVGQAMRDAGIAMLENEAVRLERRGHPLWLAVAGDEATRRADVDATLAGVPAGEPVVVATHSPDLFPALPERVTLTLAGHTHGGQANVPLLRRWWTPSRYGARYARPVVREGPKTLFVHPGIGTSKLPVRLGAAPEVSVLVLRGRRSRRRGG